MAEGLPRNPDGSFNLRAKDSGSIRLGTKQYAGFNINSSQQVLRYFNEVGIEPVDDTGKPSTDKKVLARFSSDPLVQMYLSYRKAEKRLMMAQKLAEAVDDNHRVHSRFMPLATGTGRFSSSSVNLQNIPRDEAFRCAFRVEWGRSLCVADFSGMELRIAAALAKEQRMLDAFNEGADIHQRTAALMYGIEEAEVSSAQRRAAKCANFGLLFGSGARGLMNYFATLGIFITLGEAEGFHHLWHKAYPAFGRWHRECQAAATEGLEVRTALGRRRYLFGCDNKLTVQANNRVQGTGADINKLAIIEVHAKLPRTARFVATIHDELVVECDTEDSAEVLAMMLAEMEDAGKSVLGDCVRLIGEGSVAQSWGEAK